MKISTGRLIVLGCAVFLCFLFTGCAQSLKGLSFEDAKALVIKNCPVGMERPEIEQFLNDYDVKYSVTEDEKTSPIYARVSKRSWIIIITDYVFIFYFDDSDKLTKIEAKQYHTGP